MTAVAVIGDVHGQVEALERLLSKLPHRDLLVFVGDLINRGVRSKDVLDRVAPLLAEGRAVVIAGNHERAFLAYLGGGPFVSFAAAGGLATIRSYVGTAVGDVRAEVRRRVPREHVELLETCVSHWETNEILVTHAGVPPGTPQVRDVALLADGSFPELFAGAWRAPKHLICGHYAQASKRPYVGDRFVCLDTGCGTNGGPLTALLLPEWRFVNSEP